MEHDSTKIIFAYHRVAYGDNLSHFGYTRVKRTTPVINFTVSNYTSSTLLSQRLFNKLGRTNKILNLEGVNVKMLDKWIQLHKHVEDKTYLNLVPNLRYSPQELTFRNSTAKDVYGFSYKSLRKTLNQYYFSGAHQCWYNLTRAFFKNPLMRKVRVIALKKTKEAKTIEDCGVICKVPLRLKLFEELMSKSHKEEIQNVVLHVTSKQHGFVKKRSIGTFYKDMTENVSFNLTNINLKLKNVTEVINKRINN
tara:strand:- start:66 stop:818 length:753 start_codon:yes stop_codon:yes gene_type:complete